MPRRSARHLLAGACSLAMTLASLAVVADGASARQAFPGEVPACHDPAMLNRIISRFAWADRNTWHTGLRILRIDSPGESVGVPYPQSPVPRRYCTARGFLSNGTETGVFYLIEGGLGFAGLGPHLEFCLSAFDPWHVYGGWCRTLR